MKANMRIVCKIHVIFTALIFALLFPACQKASDNSEPAREIKIQNPKALIMKARSLMEPGSEKNAVQRFENALKLLNKALEIEPDNDVVYVELGNFYITFKAFVGTQNYDGDQTPEELARQMFTKAIEINPKNTAAYRGLGLYYVVNEPEKALEAFQMVQKLSPDDPHLGLNIGMCLYEAGEYEKARKYFQEELGKAVRQKDDNRIRQAKEYLGRILLRQEKYEDAEKYLLDATKGFDQYVKDHGNYWGCPYQALGELYSRMDRPVQEAQSYIKAADVEINSELMQYDAARTSFAVGDYQNAQKYIARALAIEDNKRFWILAAKIRVVQSDGGVNPEKIDDPELLLDFALDDFEEGRFNKSLKYLDRISAAASSHLDGLKLKGYIFLFLGKSPEASILFSEVKKKESTDPGAYVGLGHIAILEKDYEKSEGLFQKALKILPDHSKGVMEIDSRVVELDLEMGLLGMGWVNANQNRHEKAIEYYDKILLGRSDSFLALLGKGNSLSGLHKLDEALEVFKKLKVQYPKNPYVLAEMALVSYNKGELARAEEMFEQVLKYDDGRYTCPYEGLGLVYLRQGKTADAMLNFQKAIEINPNIEYKKFNGLAKIFIQKGRYDEARKLLEKSMENYPYDTEAKELIESIKKLKD